MTTATTTKPLGQPIDGEDRDATVTCAIHGPYGLYFYGVRNDFCLGCARQAAKAGDAGAGTRLAQLEKLRQRAKQGQQREAARPPSRPTVGPRGARWEPWERVSAKGFSMGADLIRTQDLPAE